MIIVDTTQQGQRLDLFLALHYPQYSRSAVRKLLDQGRIIINDRTEYRPNYKVVQGDNVQLQEDDSLSRKALPAHNLVLEIVYQDQDVVVVNKPAGLKVHPTHQNETDTLINGLYGALEGNLTSYGVNLVNRIDRDTSGLVMAAISPTGAWHYAKQFAESKVQKTYLAVVYGNWPAKHGNEKLRSSVFLKYDHRLRIQTVDPHQMQGEYAETSFMSLEYSSKDRITLLQANPTTGRTHQIRVQLAHLGFPILGDRKYNGASFPRLMLHSYKLQALKPDGDKLKLVATPTPEFTDLFPNLAQ